MLRRRTLCLYKHVLQCTMIVQSTVYEAIQYTVEYAELCTHCIVLLCKNGTGIWNTGNNGTIVPRRSNKCYHDIIQLYPVGILVL